MLHTDTHQFLCVHIFDLDLLSYDTNKIKNFTIRERVACQNHFSLATYSQWNIIRHNLVLALFDRFIVLPPAQTPRGANYAISGEIWTGDRIE